MTLEKKIEKLMKFIVDNKLNFDDTDSGLNSTCCILCGYALHVNELAGARIDDTDIINAVDKSFIKIPTTRNYYVDELTRVYEFAEFNSYGKWWKTDDAKEQYKF